MAATRQPLLPTAWDGLGAPPPPRRSSKLGSTNAVPISGRRGRSLIWLAILLAAGFVVWLLMRRDVSLEDLRRTAADRSNEWLGAIAERLLAVHEQGAVRKLTTEELERLADIPWLESVLDAPTSESGSAASTSTTPPAPAPPPATRRRPETSDQELIAQHVKPTTFIPEVASFDKIAIAVKTGAATALQRVPVQAATFLRHVKNWILIGETPGMFVGERPIIDVYSSLYSEPPFPDHLGAHAGHGPNASFARAPKMSLSESGGAGHRRLLKRHNEGGHKEKDAIVPDNSAEGWKKDAHKNLPGFVHLWNNFPNADWYFMIDDDTYLFLENVVKAVEGLNPENAYYFGTPTLFVGCDGVKDYGSGPQFAHGGSGIMMSRGALIRMLGGVNRCITRYHDCWAGDVRTALCLRDAGIKLQGHRGLSFHNEPPNAKSWWPEDPCSRPTTFHHLLVKQIQKLYDLDRVQLERDEPTTYGNIFTSFLTEKERIEMSTSVDKDFNRQGMDYRHQFTASEKDCANLCREEERCKAWTWEKNEKGDGGECWLKKGIPSKTEKKGALSGVVPKNYFC